MKKALLVALAVSAAVITFGEAPDLTSQLEFVANPNLNKWPSDPLYRPVTDLQFYRGRLYNGAGEVESNPGPISIYSIDPDRKDCKLEYTAGTEQIASFLIASWGDLVSPAEDPRASGNKAEVVFVRGGDTGWSTKTGVTGTTKHGTDTVEYSVHNWDVIEHDSRMFVAGYGISASTDRFKTFTDASSSIANTNMEVSQRRYKAKMQPVSSSILLRQNHFVKVDDELFSVYSGIYQPNIRRGSSYTGINQTKGMWYDKSAGQFVFIDIDMEDVYPDLSSSDFKLSFGTSATNTFAQVPTDTYFTTRMRIWRPTPFNDRCLYVACVDNESYTAGGDSSSWFRNTSYPLSVAGYSAEKASEKSGFSHRFTATKLDFGTETFPMDFCVIGGACYALTTHFDSATGKVNHGIWKSTDGLAFTKIIAFDFHQNFISLERHNGYFYVGAGYKGLRHSYAYGNEADESGAIYRIPDPEAGVRVVATSATSAIAGGESATVAFALESAPSSNVTVSVVADTVHAVTLDRNSLTFTPSNWATPQSVTVTADNVVSSSAIGIVCGVRNPANPRGEFESGEVCSALAAVPVKVPAEMTEKWYFDSASQTLTDYIWTFSATVSGTNITVGTARDAECPDVVTALDFSKPIVGATDETKRYAITALNTAFCPNNGTPRTSSEFVGELTLPATLKTVGSEAFNGCANLTGDLVFPPSLTSLGTAAFKGTAITSADFQAATATLSGNYDRGVFMNCKQLKRVRFSEEGRFTFNHYPFSGCTSLGDADISGVVSASVSKNTYAAFNGCTALTNVTIGTELTLANSGAGTLGNALFYKNTALKSVRFIGAPPAALADWIASDGGYLGVIADTQTVTTYVPAEAVEAWKPFAASGTISASGTTFAAAYVKTGVDVSKRPLLCLAAPPEDPVVPSGSVDVTSALVDLGCPAAGKYKGTDFTNLTARACLRLVPYRGRIYVGMGDYTYNCGPVPVMSIDPQTGDCITEFTAGTEAIDDFKVFSDGCLYVPSLDEKEGATNHGHFFRRDTNGVWTVFNSVPKGSTGSSDAKLYTHCWDLAEYNGKIHFAGYGTASSTFTCTNFTANTSPKFIARTTNVLCYVNNTYSGFHRQLNYLNRIYSFIEVGDELYGIPKLPYTPTYPYADSQDADKPYLWHYNKAQNKFVKENTEWSRLIPDMTLDDAFWYSKTVLASTYSVGTSDVIVEKTLTFGDKGYYIVTGNYMPWIGCVARIVDGKFTAAKLDFGTATWPQEFIKDGDAVYALCYSMDGNEVVNKVFKSVDGDNFTEILHFRHRQYATAMCRYNGSFFFSFGTQEEIYRSSHPTAAGYTKSLEYNGVILRCADPGSDQPVVEHTHVWGNWVTNVFPTATTAGERYRECTAEGCTNPVARETETIPALGGGDDPDPQEGSDLTASLVNHGIPLSSKYTTQYYARNPWDLKAFEGRLYIGSGNSANTGPNTNAGPVPIKSYNPATSNCVDELVIQQEQIDVFRILDDGGLYIPGHDPKGGNGSVYLRSLGSSGANAWKQFNNLTACEHCYDVTMFDGKFIASGSNLWVSPNTNAANVAAFSAYNISGRRYAMLQFPNTLYAVGTAMVGGTVGTLTYADNFGIDRLPKGGAFAPVENAGSTTRRYADKQYVFPGIDDMVVKKEYIVQRPVSFGSRVIYIGGLSHNDHQLLPLAAFSAVDGDGYFTATRIALPEGAVPWDTLVAGDKVYLLWTTKSGDKFINHVSESSDGLAFTEIFCFTADSFARSFEYLKRRFYFGLGAENVDIFNPYSAANNSLLSAASGTILSCPYDLNLPEDDIEYPQEDEPVTPPDPNATAKAVWDANTNTFTFYYDTNTYEGNGITQYALPTENKWNTEPAWKGADWKSSVTKVVFAASFAAYQPINMNYWFDGFSNLTTIEGMEYLKTSSAGYCTSMFGGCSSLTSLDLSHFDTTTMKFRNFFNGCSNIEVLDLTSFTKFSDLRGAFSGMSKLKTIYVADILDCDADSTTSDTFKGCNALVGGGNPPTTFAEAKITHGEYARIDNPPDAPGYFTLKGTEPIDPPVEPEDPPAGTVTITLTAPADGAMYDTHLQALKKYLANSDARSEFPDDDLIAARDTDGNHYVHNAWFTNLLVEASVEQATYKPFTWEKTGDITDIVVEYSEDADFTEGNVISEKYCRDNETSTRPLNLKLATKYWWRVKAKDANGGDVVSDVRTFTTEGVAPRIIGTLGFNMRDLGGGTNAEGLVVRQGVILRGKCPMARVNAEAGWNDQKMTEQSYREFYLDKHHIKTELDFRSAEEALEHQTRYDEIEISTIGIDHFNMEIFPYHYGHALTSSNICQAVKMLAEGTHYPVYFNCAVGSDRTGTFGTIIDGIVGRDDQWFYDNYELPSFDSGLARLRYNRKGSEMFEYLQARNPGEHFRDRVVQYLLGIGVTREDIRAIRAAMLELPNEGDTRELKSAKAVYTEADQTLTLRYDNQDYSGVDGQLQCAVSRGGWESLTNDVRHLVFAPSFADYRVESCLQWFENFRVLEDVAGLEYFDTSLATTLRGMFTGCSSLTEIDFSGHDLSKCTNLGNMFYKCSALKSVDFTEVDTSNVVDFYRTFSGCSSLTNIYVTEEFDASGYTDLTKEVFKGCSKLVGGAGTKFNSEHINIEYARVDNPPDAPGYFTLKGAEPVDPPVVEHKHVWGNWVTNKVATATEAGERYRECTAEGCTNPVARETETIPALGGGDDPVTPYPPDPEDPDKDLSEDAELAARAVRIGDTIRFYYDKKSHARAGSTVSVIPVAGTRTWLSPGADNFEITNVIFYSSFKSFKPQSMASWFQYYRALKNVVGLHNIDTSEVKRMDNLFRCKSGNNPNITELDLSAWDTRNCTNMGYMFARLSGLKTIYVSDKFVVTQVMTSDSMFDRCSAIVGGAGTKYLDSTEGKDKTRAKVDGGTENPGYFTYMAVSSDPVIVKPELGSATIVSGDGKMFRISVSNPVVGAAYTLFTATSLDGEFTAEADSTIYASGDLFLDFAIEDGVPQKFAKIVISTTPYKQGDPLPEE